MSASNKSIVMNFKKYRYLLWQLIVKDIKLKYRRSYLGILWTLIEPLLTMIVLSVVFSQLYNRKGGSFPFPVYILTGRLLYTYFANATKGAMKSIRSNSGMIKKVYVPKYMYPLASILSNFIIFAISLIVLVIVAVVMKVQPSWHLFESLISLFLLLVMTMGIGLILATLAVFFRDLEYLWGVILMIVMYCSAIFYEPVRVVRNGYGWILDANPLYAVIRNFRNSVLFGTGLHTKSMLYLAIASVLSLVIGVVLFYKKQDDFILNI